MGDGGLVVVVGGGELVEFLYFGFVAVVVCGEVLGELVAEVGVLQDSCDALGAFEVVEGDDYSVDAVLDLAWGCGVVGDDYGFAEHLCFADGYAFSFVA